MKLIDELKKRSEAVLEEDNIKTDLKLYTLALDVAEKAKEHLKRITAILSEFDVHDQDHSKRVIENIEKLLGSKIQELSTYEIFLLYLSAFLHDTGMAPSDFETNTMKLTEGYESFVDNSFSIKNDNKPPYKFIDAKKLIETNHEKLYKSFDYCKNWIFIHEKEEDLIKYLAELLIEYQNFRNGFKKELENVDSLEKFKQVNKNIRIDFIRLTHHKRAGLYVKNLERKFAEHIEPSAIGKKLSHDLAEVCRAHGENIEYIESFDKSARYYGIATTNLQMVAMLLRLGDIIHYSFDRAPASIMFSKMFKSQYSFQEWMVKHSGATYEINKGLITYNAYCDDPNNYFKLHNYIDWIDLEIQNYFRLQRSWDVKYIEHLGEKVERHIDNDKSKFLPKRGLGFSLNQKKILELLKGVGLYKDEYACLREIYQNSLDACKCMIAKNKLLGSKKNGNIEFGIEDNKGEIYVYCLDNGIGMNKSIIENYLLNVGNSYYNSFDFFKDQAKWGGGFTPTSQFGIGILSCFMIGHTVEITTKNENDEYISCVIEGVDGNFYYKESELIDSEKISSTGTLIKIFLNSNVKSISTENIQKWGIGILAWPYGEYDDNYKVTISKWENHLLKYVSTFIQEVPDNFDIKVKLNDGSSIPVLSKPFYILEHKEVFGVDMKEDEIFFGEFILHDAYPDPMDSIADKTPTVIDIHDNIIPYRIHIEEGGLHFNSFFYLPNYQFDFIVNDWGINNFIVGRSDIMSIDGIIVESNGLYRDTYNKHGYFLSILCSLGTLNFTGKTRPNISIDRNSVISYPDECEIFAKKITNRYLNEIITITIKHLESHNYLNDFYKFEDLCNYILSILNIPNGDTLFIEELAKSSFGDIKLENLYNITNQDYTLREFVDAETIKFKSNNYKNFNFLIKCLLSFKLDNSSNIIIEEDFIIIQTKNKNNHKDEILEYIYADNTSIPTQEIYEVSSWKPFNSEYDLITAMFPFLPTKMFNLLDYETLNVPASKKFLPHKYSHIVELFSLTPFSINADIHIDEDKLYSQNGFQKYNFFNRKASVLFSEIKKEEGPSKIAIMIFVSPQTIKAENELALNYYKESDPEYVRGIREGWSILYTSVENRNFVILPGKVKRDDLVKELPLEFWNEYDDLEFIFTDGTSMKKNEG